MGGAISAGSRIISNISAGRTWHDGAVGAFVGGTVGTGTFILTGSSRAGSYAGAAAESITNEAGQYITGKKELNWKNFGDSVGNVLADTAVNGTIDYGIGRVTDKYAPYNPPKTKSNKTYKTYAEVLKDRDVKVFSPEAKSVYKYQSTVGAVQTMQSTLAGSAADPIITEPLKKLLNNLLGGRGNSISTIITNTTKKPAKPLTTFFTNRYTVKKTNQSSKKTYTPGLVFYSGGR